MDNETLKKACEEYKRQEGRASFYDVALEIVDTYPLQASIIILATWNSGAFRFSVNDTQNLFDLQKAIKEVDPLFERVERRNFKAGFDKIGDTVKKIYSTLSKVKGVKYTGASKVMHLLNRELFVMWDTKVREELGYGTTDEDYLNFLKEMHRKFKNLEWSISNKTLAKAIDEYNQVTYNHSKKAKQENKKET
jgi:hypothetical protein